MKKMTIKPFFIQFSAIFNKMAAILAAILDLDYLRDSYIFPSGPLIVKT